MNIQENVSLAQYSTMGIGGQAAYLTHVDRKEEIPETLEWAAKRKLPVVMLGGGSNTLWRDEGFPGLVLVNKIMGYESKDEDSHVLLTIGAGENWDSVCARSVEAGLTGIEALSMVPGTTGATPIQNVGAYGQEIAQTLVSLSAYDSQSGGFVIIDAADCNFSYRNSRFKSGPDKGRFYINEITLRLVKGIPQPPFYASLEAYFEEHGISEYTPAAVRAAVMEIRKHKLPDPSVVRNNGSFFHNPVIEYKQLERISNDYGTVPHWPFGEDKIKLSAAWLIEQAGFKDYHDLETGMATWPQQPLVLYNENAKSLADLLTFKKKITDAVETKFGIQLTQEPEILPAD